MAEKTAGRRRHLSLGSYLVVGFFAILGVSEIVFIATGVQRLDDPRNWLAFAGAIFIVGALLFVLVGNVAGFLILKMRGPTRTLSSSVFEINLDGFDSQYEELLRHIDMLPDIGRKTEGDYKRRLLEIVNALKEIRDKLAQMSGTHPYKEDLQELERQLGQQSAEWLGIHSTFETLWTRFRTRGSGFNREFRKALGETSQLEMLLLKSLEHARKKEKALK